MRGPLSPAQGPIFRQFPLEESPSSLRTGVISPQHMLLGHGSAQQRDTDEAQISLSLGQLFPYLGTFLSLYPLSDSEDTDSQGEKCGSIPSCLHRGSLPNPVLLTALGSWPRPVCPSLTRTRLPHYFPISSHSGATPGFCPYLQTTWTVIFFNIFTLDGPASLPNIFIL